MPTYTLTTLLFKKSPGVLMRALRSVLSVFVALTLSLTPLLDVLNIEETPKAEAAYSGKYLRTVEFVLGDGSDRTSRAANTVVYAGNTWNTTKGTASTRNVYLDGTNIKVRSAYLETGFQSIDGATDIGEIRMNISVTPGDSAGTDIPIDPVLQGATILDNSGLHIEYRARADVTHVFQRQTDTEWQQGIGVVGSLNSVDVGRGLSYMKLIITYEEDYSTASHTATKTVRFPLDSTTSGDTGSTRATSTPNSDNIFEYRAEMPDLSANADILDVWFEFHTMTDGTTNSSSTIAINGSTASTTYQMIDTVLDSGDRFVIHRVATGSPNFIPNATSTIIYRNGANAPVNAIGGEVIVTYRYSTGAASQTETISYMATTTRAAVGTTKTSFSVPAHIANTGFDVRNIWYRVKTPQTGTTTLTVFGTVGASAEQSQAYALGSTTLRTTGSVLYMDMSPTVGGDFTSATTTVSGAIQWSSTTGDAQVSVELFITFTWDGSGGGPQTKTNRFFGGNSPSGNPTASLVHSFPAKIYAPETVPKFYQDAYLRMTVMHNEATTIAVGTVTFGVNASTTALTEDSSGDATAEGFMAEYLHPIASSTITGNTGSSFYNPEFSWTEKSFMVRSTINQADEYAFTGELVVTYRVELAAPASDPEMTILHYRWRADDASEDSASPLAAEDTALTSGLYVGDKARLRFLISSTGDGSASNVTYLLEHSSTSCSLWLPVATTANGAHWAMSDSGYVVNGQATTHYSGLTAPGGQSFVAGFMQTSSNQTGAHSLSTTEYTEHEYVISSTSYVTPGTTYCFRLTNAGVSTYFVYSVEPQVSVEAAVQRPIYGGGGGEGSGSGSQQTGGGAGGGGVGEGGGSGGQQGGGGSGGGGGGDSG